MEKRNLSDSELFRVRRVLTEILDSMEDERQHIRDCIKTLKELQKTLEPDSKSFWKRLKEKYL